MERNTRMVNQRTSEEIEDELKSLLTQAVEQFYEDDVAATITLYERAVVLCEAINDSTRLANTKINLGILEQRIGRYGEALRHYTEALDIGEERSIDRIIASSCANLGGIFNAVGQYSECLKYYLRSLDLYTAAEDSEGIARVTANIGKVYEATQDYDHALDYLGQSREMYEQLDDQPMVGYLLGSIGSVLSNQGNLDQALVKYTEALHLFEESEYTVGVALASMFIASILVRQGALKDARTYLDMADEITLVDPKMVIEREETRATLLIAEGDLNMAESTLHIMLDMATEIGARNAQRNAHKFLRDVARKAGDLDAYVLHNDKYTDLADRLSGADTQRQLALQNKERELAIERQQREQERAILYSTLPRNIADRVLAGDTVSGDFYESAAVLFLDVVGFTSLSSNIPPGHVVHLLDAIFTKCDIVCGHHQLTKIKTIGDSYMAVSFGGSHHEASDVPPNVRAADAALELITALASLEVSMDSSLGNTSWVNTIPKIDVRIGIHSGPVVAGIIGRDRLQYDVWGDTVNVASRMESTGEPARIQVSEEFAKGLGTLADGLPGNGAASEDQSRFTLSLRGNVDIKGKGAMRTFWLS